MIHTCAKNQANQEGSCISSVSVLQKVTLNNLFLTLQVSKPSDANKKQKENPIRQHSRLCPDALEKVGVPIFLKNKIFRTAYMSSLTLASTQLHNQYL